MSLKVYMNLKADVLCISKLNFFHVWTPVNTYCHSNLLSTQIFVFLDTIFKTTMHEGGEETGYSKYSCVSTFQYLVFILYSFWFIDLVWFNKYPSSCCLLSSIWLHHGYRIKIQNIIDQFQAELFKASVFIQNLK